MMPSNCIRFELGYDHRLRSLTKVGEAKMHVAAKGLQPFLLGGVSGQRLCGVQAGKSGVVGIREINECGFQPDYQEALLGGLTGVLRCGLRFIVHIQMFAHQRSLDDVRRSA